VTDIIFASFAHRAQIAAPPTSPTTAPTGKRPRSPTRLNDKQALATEEAALEADEEDRAEMLAVADLMESLCAPR
jgi:hypothetical protein